MHEEREIGRQDDGARILWRRWFADPLKPSEGHVRELSADGRYVRISETLADSDRGSWYDTTQVRLVRVLEPAKADVARRALPREAGT